MTEGARSARVSEKATVGVVFTAAVFMSALDTTIVNVALPTIGRGFAVAPTAVDGISVAYLVSLALFMPVSGWLGDRFGGKRILLTATVVFTVASALCGAATSLGELVAFRALQGVGGGMMTPVGMAMLFRAFPPGERLRASALLVLPTTLGPASGPVLGGLLVSELSWRWVFWVNIPIGVAAVTFGAVFLRHRAEDRPGRFDLAGFLLSGVGLGLLMYGVSEGPNAGWASPVIVSGIVAGAILLGVAVLVEYRAAEPIVAVRLLGDRLFRTGTAANILMTSGFIGTLFVMSLYLQDGRAQHLPRGRRGRRRLPAGQPGALPAARPPPAHGRRADRHRHGDRPDGSPGRPLQPVVGQAADVRHGVRDGPGDADHADGIVRHDLIGGDRPGLDHVQRGAAAGRRDRRGAAHHDHRPGRRHSPCLRSPGRQPGRLPGRVPRRRRVLPGRRALCSFHQ
jgi:MFS family permease